ncbi:hypothetical protein EDB85DRAFT_1894087 [Lactarius pseudohatsudake]|nr:hypothetical protein EDB85DRAFT_1894087 [Lactarius pseudohatsudake]
MWSWSVVGGACDSGLPAAAAAIIVIMLGVVGSLEELKRWAWGTGSRSRRLPPLSLSKPSSWGCASAPQICVNAVSCWSSVWEFTRLRATVHASSTQPWSVACKLSGVHTISASKSGSVAWSWSLVPSPYKDCPCAAQMQHERKSKWGGQFEATATELVQWWLLRRLKGVELEWGRAACIVRTQERPTDGQLGKAVVCKYEAPKLHHACDEAIRVEVGAVWELEALGSGYRRDGLEHLNVELIWVNRGKW